ncbi:Dihydropteroate synthase, related [Neospora caninum Liverpool]|nr:Dihydropteroate synthase, related [Neospora caninum Liverpool]CBZ52934.1 Dihydropteroate synthase, related [Neospora caninum Liverpool]|eukprot:XP_003882966.1 Dihydropteroate synthase, related [Neospora caninum Liverpool]
MANAQFLKMMDDDLGTEHATAYIALGSNLHGEARLGIIEETISEMRRCLGPILGISCLYETIPAFDVCPKGVVHDLFHPFYLNAVLKLRTHITDPWNVLEILKDLEAKGGRALPAPEEVESLLNGPTSSEPAKEETEQGGAAVPQNGGSKEALQKKYVRGAPRLLDLDLIFFDKEGKSCVIHPDAVRPADKKWPLTLPHPRMVTRNFVLFPLCDIDPEYVHPVEGVAVKELLRINLERRRIRLLNAAEEAKTHATQTHTGIAENPNGADLCAKGKPPRASLQFVHGYTIDGSLAIPRRCFAATTEQLWTLGGDAGVVDTLRYIEDVKRHADEKIKAGGDDGLTEAQRRQLLRVHRLEENLRQEHPLKVMGILNVSPDSFSDQFSASVDEAVAAAETMVEDGADVVDVGGEATNPFREAGGVPLAVERARVLPVVKKIAEQLKNRVIISVDTMKAEIAREAVAAGAAWVNDQTGESRTRADGDPLASVVDNSTAIVLMHKRGTPDTFDSYQKYEDVVGEVGSWLANMSEALQRCGVGRWRILVDPGLGIAKNPEQSFELVRAVKRIKQMLPTGIPMLLGFSRKRFIGWAVGETSLTARPTPDAVERRRWGGAAIVAWCAANADAVAVIRTHDVKDACTVRDVAEKIHGVNSPTGWLDKQPDMSSLYSFWN